MNVDNFAGEISTKYILQEDKEYLLFTYLVTYHLFLLGPYWLR